MQASAPFCVFSTLSAVLAGARKLLIGHSVKFGQVVPLILRASNRLRSFDCSMQSLVARWKAGTLKIWPKRARKPPPPRPAATEDDPEDAAPERLPRRFGWLSDMIRPDGFMTADALRQILADPEMSALIAATPLAGRLLRSVCQMYGVRDDRIALPKRHPPKGDAPARPAKPKPARKKRWRWRDIVPLGRTFPLADDQEAWAEWLRRSNRAMRRSRGSHFRPAKG